MEQDFGRTWLGRLSESIEAEHGSEVRTAVMKGSENLCDASPAPLVIDWTREAMQRLEDRVAPEAARRILLSCACHCPDEALAEARRRFREEGTVSAAHEALQQQFERFLTDVLLLDDSETREVLSRGWGMAGILEGNLVTATKIPKSENLRTYLREKDPQRRRDLYCHCPRVREATRLPGSLPTAYCYCGAGYYQDLWQRILERPVKIRLVSSVLAGDEVCTVEIDLASMLRED